MCNSCSAMEKAQSLEKYKLYKKMQAQEKFDELCFIQEEFECNGCSPNCCFDLNAYKAFLNIKYTPEEAWPVLSSILEWDHLDRTLKSKRVSKIFNQARRRREIKLCQLLCTICHRFKTWINVDARSVHCQGPQIPRSFLQKLLQEKLDQYEATGGCAGFNMEGEDVCPMKSMVDSLKKYIQDDHAVFDTELSAPLLLMMAFDWDHKETTEQARRIISTILNDDDRRDEIAGCNLLCCFCHKRKSWLTGDYISCFLLPVNCETLENDDHVDMEDTELEEDELSFF